MGLCKCPKRKVTNLFCFEHDVNVCEYCLVSNHERCIVQSYVQWLQDSDYNPICILCKRLLADESTVRLICYDVFHWSCLNKYAASLPSTTAPAGYQCPKCKECIFPPSNLVSPVVDALKSKLIQANWAKIGLGQSVIDTTSTTPSQNESNNQPSNTIEDENDFVIVANKQQKPNESNLPKLTNTNTSTRNNDFPYLHGTTNKAKTEAYRAYNPNIDTTSKSHSRTIINNNKDDNNGHSSSTSSSSMVLNLNNDRYRDSDDNKYKRRPLFEWLGRLLKSRQTPNSKGYKINNAKKRCLFLSLLICLCFFTIILIFARLSSIRTDNDPFLDPMNNPNIRVE